MHPLRISLLGTPLIEVEGRPLRVDTRKATAMLAHLVVSGHPESREVVAALLWPEFDIDRSRSALRRTLSTLRTALDGRFIAADRNSISIDLGDAWFDLAEFRRTAADPAATAEELATAVDLHRGDLLAGFSVRDSATFDDWQQLAAEGIRRERAAALDRLVGALAAAGRRDEAVGRAEERLALDPVHEPAHRRLIERYAASGRRGDAMQQYRECVRVLDRELGVRPLTRDDRALPRRQRGAQPGGRRGAGRARPRRSSRWSAATAHGGS